MPFDPAQARGRIVIRFVDKDFSRFAVYPIIASYLLDYLKLDLHFKKVLKMRNNNFSFSGTDYLLTLVTVIFLGIKRIYKIDDLLANEYQLAKILGFKKEQFPNSTRIYRLLSQMDHWTVKRLDRINFELIKPHQQFFTNKRWLTVDIDQTKKITEGKRIEKAKPCYVSGKKGRLGLRISAATVNGIVFSQKLEPGNIGNADAFDGLFRDTLTKTNQLLPKKRNSKKKRIILRIDGGYFSTKTIQAIEKVRKKRPLDFIVRAKDNLKLIKAARQGKSNQFVKLYKNRDLRVLVLEDQQILESLDHTYKVLIVKDKQKRTKSKNKQIIHSKRKYEYALVTSLKHWSAKRMIEFYKGRQLIENVFKEHNQSFQGDKLPSHAFWGNALYFQMISLIFNVAFFFKAGVADQTIPKCYIRNYTRQTNRFSWRDQYL